MGAYSVPSVESALVTCADIFIVALRCAVGVEQFYDRNIAVCGEDAFALVLQVLFVEHNMGSIRSPWVDTLLREPPKPQRNLTTIVRACRHKAVEVEYPLVDDFRYF